MAVVLAAGAATVAGYCIGHFAFASPRSVDSKISRISKMSSRTVARQPRPMMRRAVRAMHGGARSSCLLCEKPYGHKDVVALLKCGHMVHKKCAEKWSQTRVHVGMSCYCSACSQAFLVDAFAVAELAGRTVILSTIVNPPLGQPRGTTNKPGVNDDAALAQAWKQKFVQSVVAKVSQEQVEFEKRLQQQYTNEVRNMVQSTTAQKQADRDYLQMQLQEIRAKESCVQRQCVELGAYAEDLNAWHVSQQRQQQDRERQHIEEVQLALLMAEKELQEQQRVFSENLVVMMQHANTHSPQPIEHQPTVCEKVTVSEQSEQHVVSSEENQVDDEVVVQVEPVAADAKTTTSSHLLSGAERDDSEHKQQATAQLVDAKAETAALCIGPEVVYPVFNEFIFF